MYAHDASTPSTHSIGQTTLHTLALNNLCYTLHNDYLTSQVFNSIINYNIHKLIVSLQRADDCERAT